MTHKISLASLRVASSQAPAGYYEEVIAIGRVENDVLFLEQDVYLALDKKYAPRVQPISLGRKALNLAGAGGRVIKAAAHNKKILVSNEEKDRRMAICIVCDHFVAGTCDLCGCTAKWKTKLATESCPIGKW